MRSARLDRGRDLERNEVTIYRKMTKFDPVKETEAKLKLTVKQTQENYFVVLYFINNNRNLLLVCRTARWYRIKPISGMFILYLLVLYLFNVSVRFVSRENTFKSSCFWTPPVSYFQIFTQQSGNSNVRFRKVNVFPASVSNYQWFVFPSFIALNYMVKKH